MRQSYPPPHPPAASPEPALPKTLSSSPPLDYAQGMTATRVTPETVALRDLLDTYREDLLLLMDKYAATNPKLFGSVARGAAGPDSDIDILVEMDPADGNILMRASGLMEETRELLGREDVDIFPVQLLKDPISESARRQAVQL